MDWTQELKSWDLDTKKFWNIDYCWRLNLSTWKLVKVEQNNEPPENQVLRLTMGTQVRIRALLTPSRDISRPPSKLLVDNTNFIIFNLWLILN